MGGVDKLLQLVAGRPLFAWTLDAFAGCDRVDDIVVVASEANLREIDAIAVPASPKVRSVVPGGERRRDSVRNGLLAVPEDDYVVVHDGARPLVTTDLVEAAIDGALESGAALCAVPIADTVKRSNDEGFVRGTVSREHLFLAQTPQAFRREILLRAHDEVAGDLTDDASMVETLGLPVKLVAGSALNLKVTTPEDLELAAAVIAGRKRGR